VFVLNEINFHVAFFSAIHAFPEIRRLEQLRDACPQSYPQGSGVKKSL
jgi:hypothetical protein